MTQTAGPAQSWNLRTVSMPFWMISNCSAQMTTKQITSSPEWPRNMRRLVERHQAVAADQQRDDRARSRAGLRAVPEAGDDGAHQRRQIGAPDAEGGARQDGIGHAGFDAGVADQAHQDKDHQRADPDREHKIDEAAAQQKQAGGEVIAPEAVNVRGPDVEDAEGAPVAHCRRARDLRCRGMVKRSETAIANSPLIAAREIRLISRRRGRATDHTAKKIAIFSPRSERSWRGEVLG